jgi:hypothetical protein
VAAVLNVTVTNAHGSGYISAFGSGYVGDSCDNPAPSNINYSPGQTVPNLVTAEVGTAGYVCLTNNGASAGTVDLIADIYDGGSLAKSTDIVADVVGYYSADSAGAYVPDGPNRIYDSRTVYPPNGGNPVQMPLANGAETVVATLPYTQIAGIGTTDVTALALNVTVTNTEGSSFLSVFPSDTGNLPVILPNTSNLNWVKGETVANFALIEPGTDGDGSVGVYNGGAGGGLTDFILDISGYYATN